MQRRTFFRNTATLLVAVLFFTSVFVVRTANAAAITSASDTLSSMKISTLSSHTIRFTTPTGAAESTDTIIVTFPSDFNFTSKTIGTVTFTHGASTGAESTETLAASPSATAWGAVFSGTQNRVLTLTAPTDGVGTASVAASDKIILTYDSTNSTNGSSATSYVIAISGTFGDSGNITVNLLTDDQVAVTATVGQTLSFSLSSNSIGFGTITTSAGRFATGGGGSDTTPASGHTMAIATNAPTGYSITYNGATLTSGGNTIDVATVSSDADGSPGTEQFAIGFTTNGNATIVSAYGQGSNNYKFVASTTTTIVSETVPTATETITAYYLANIAATTEAGSYSTAITYIATANF